ncbi:MAG: Mur ligase family protein [Firmicutes bacterium]|nr:Mur ligase family protein [Bacillota bacterium]
MFSTFREAISYLFATYTSSKSHRGTGYDQETRTPWYTRTLLDRMGSPDRKARNILVTGSKGKGSTSRLIAELLESQGLRVGLFTSPHLIDYTERIRVNGRAIEESDMMRILAQMQPFIEEIRSTFGPRDYFGPVGLIAVIAAIYFQEHQTDVNVIELGRGARYDDVNQLSGELAVVTPILWEHADCLGPNIEQIAWHKSGVIHAGMRAVIVGRQGPEAESVLRAEAQTLGVDYREMCFAFSVKNVRPDRTGVRFSVTTQYGEREHLHVSLLGSHQADNAGVALETVEYFLGHAVPLDAITRAFQQIVIPGRCQLLPPGQNHPEVLIDGAINRESASYVAHWLDRFAQGPVYAVVGIPREKDYSGALAWLGPRAAEIYVTVAANPHLHFPQDALQVAQAWCPAHYVQDSSEAIGQAMAKAGPQGIVVIMGTQSLVGEALSYFQVPTRHTHP